MKLPENYDYKEEEQTVISNVIHNYMHPKQPDNPYTYFLKCFGLIKQKEPDINSATNFVKIVLANKHKKDPDYLQELGRIREIYGKIGRAIPIIGRSSRHKGTDMKLYRPGMMKYLPQINVNKKYISQMKPLEAIKAVTNSDTTSTIKSELILHIIKQGGVLNE